MKSELQIETEKPEKLRKVVEPSLEDNKQVRHEIISLKNEIKLKTKTDTLGQLRGATDGMFRILSLAKKIIER